MKRSSIISILLCILFLPVVVFAGGDNDDLVSDDCINEGTCIELCRYENKENSSGKVRQASIIYSFNGNWMITWEGWQTNPVIYTEKDETLSGVLGKSGINDKANLSEANFKCPKYGYIDNDTYWIQGDSICFDNDSSSCDDLDGLAINFDAEGFTIEKKYDYANDLDNYFSNWSFGDIKCSEFADGTYTSADDIVDKIEKDLVKNYLRNNIMPEFIKNTEAYKNIVNKVTESFNTQKELCLGNPDNLSDEEQAKVEENLGKIEEELPEKIEEAANNSFGAQLTSGPSLKPQTCESLLGDPEIEGTPAFYLVVVFKVIKYVAIILLLVMTIMDFVGAVAAQDNDVLKKAVGKLLKRAILCVVIFILPTLIEFVLSIINDSATESCNIW